MEYINVVLEEDCDSDISLVYRDKTTNLPIDLTGYTAELQIRPQFGSEIVYQTLSSGTGEIILGNSSGTIDVIFTKLSSKQGSQPYNSWTSGVHDIVVTDGAGISTKIAKGFITINRSATLV